MCGVVLDVRLDRRVCEGCVQVGDTLEGVGLISEVEGQARKEKEKEEHKEERGEHKERAG